MREVSFVEGHLGKLFITFRNNLNQTSKANLRFIRDSGEARYDVGRLSRVDHENGIIGIVLLRPKSQIKKGSDAEHRSQSVI